jgi:hypothetical protein
MRPGIFIAALVALVLVPLAHADGLPVSDAGAPAIAGGDNGGARFVALPTPHGTAVARFGGVVYTSRVLTGRYTVPVVALDHTSSGLSKDGSTLVLITPRRSFPRARTTFAVLDAPTLRLRETVVLDGDYSFDALSPDGTRMYLVHYQSRTDPTRYEVRAFDLANDRLLPEPVVDPTEVDEQMRGFPVTRTTSADGRFAYTLYDGAGKTPFVHALDTGNGEARCIDLDMLAGRQDLYDLRLSLSLGGTRLAVLKGNQEVTAVDTRTYLPAAHSAPEKKSSAPWLPIALVAVAGLLAAGGALYGLRRWHRRGAYGASPDPS